MHYPNVIIYIDAEISEVVKTTIKSQLYISIENTGSQFDALVSINPNYVKNQRILVLRDLQDFTNREYADVVLFYKKGLLYVENNKYGPPGQTFTANNITLSKLFPYYE